MGIFSIVVVLILILLVLISNIKIVPQAHAYVLERLGGYKDTWSVGIHFKMPIWYSSSSISTMPVDR